MHQRVSGGDGENFFFIGTSTHLAHPPRILHGHRWMSCIYVYGGMREDVSDGEVENTDSMTYNGY